MHTFSFENITSLSKTIKGRFASTRWFSLRFYPCSIAFHRLRVGRRKKMGCVSNENVCALSDLVQRTKYIKQRDAGCPTRFQYQHPRVVHGCCRLATSRLAPPGPHLEKVCGGLCKSLGWWVCVIDSSKLLPCS